MGADNPVSIGGSVQGQNVVIGGTQEVHGNLSITVGAGPGPADERERLQQLIDQLTAELSRVPAEHAAEVDEVVLAAEDAVRETEGDSPEQGRLRLRGEALTRAAARLAEIGPGIVALATQVAEAITRFG
ncbi:hypothetical protein AB5J49_10135 [Streptomyces sp. R28]|jgi:hypothetical protein|uniref:DUF4404 family protein n=1 Tax=Streptomyces sp. R28 TaxID=3238628 RepID=A0AB39PXH8_9ACTN